MQDITEITNRQVYKLVNILQSVMAINYLGVILAAFASMIVGFLWYSKMIFGKQWARFKGYTKETLKKAQAGMGKLYGLSFVMTLLMAYVLAHVMILSNSFYGYGMLQTGITSAIFMWLGFIMPVQFTNQIFGEKKWGLFFIDTGYQLISLLAMGIVISLF